MNQQTQGIAEHGSGPEPDAGVRNFTMLLSSTSRGARLARLLAVDTLRSWGLPHERASHVIAELAANAATHGRLPGRSFRLTLYVVGATLRIEVTDTRGDRMPAPQVPDIAAESGRGLLLVDALADRWGVTEGRFPRKTVWAELDFTPPEPAPSRSGAVTSSRTSIATSPGCSSPPATRPTWPPASPPGWSGTSPPPPYAAR